MPAQQGWPAPPQVAHTLLVRPQAREGPQERLPQQGWPAPPQIAQLPFAQVTDGAVHTLSGQHPSPDPPQVPQAPLAQIPPLPGHAEPLPVQTLFRQQPPPPQVLSAQQASPAPPQWVHVPGCPVQTFPEEHWRPEQQACPAPPQAWQVPPVQTPWLH